MKTIVTTVGTSLIYNFKEKNPKYNLGSFEDSELNSKLVSKGNYQDEFKERLDDEYKKLLDFGLENYPKSSAELTSLEKLKEKYPKEDFIIFLLASDTYESYFVAEVLKDILEEKNWTVKTIKYINFFNPNINNRDLIKKGYKELIKYVNQIVYGYNEILNITGGYKAFIPVMTLMATLKKIPLIYLFENSNYLIEIPPAPFALDLSIIDKVKDILEYVEEYTYIEDNSPVFLKVLNSLPENKKKEIEYLLEEYENGKLTTSVIGDILWEKYKSIETVKLEECNIPINEKKINSGRHHGKEKVVAFGAKLLKSKYVCEIINSAEYSPKNNNFIQEIEPDGKTGVIKIKIPNEIFTLLVKTTGRNKKETEKIAQILEEKYGG